MYLDETDPSVVKTIVTDNNAVCGDGNVRMWLATYIYHHCVCLLEVLQTDRRYMYLLLIDEVQLSKNL